MNYHRITTNYPQHRTGSPSVGVDLKPGFDWYLDDTSIDAPACIVCGGSLRQEWVNTLDENVISWFPAQHITLRG